MSKKFRRLSKIKKSNIANLLTRDFLVVLLSEIILIGLFFLLPDHSTLSGLNLQASDYIDYTNQEPILTTSINANQLIKLTNKQRIKNGLLPLLNSRALTQTAHQRAQDMLARNYFSHQTPEGNDFSINLKKLNYHYNFAGENLALDFFTNQAIIDGWLASPKHRDNILNPNFQEIGIAVATGIVNSRPKIIVVQLFGGVRQAPSDLIVSQLNPQTMSTFTFKLESVGNTQQFLGALPLSTNELILPSYQGYPYLDLIVPL